MSVGIEERPPLDSDVWMGRKFSQSVRVSNAVCISRQRASKATAPDSFALACAARRAVTSRVIVSTLSEGNEHMGDPHHEITIVHAGVLVFTMRSQRW